MTKQKCRLGTASDEITGGGGGGGASTNLRSTKFRLSSALVPETLSCLVCVDAWKITSS